MGYKTEIKFEGKVHAVSMSGDGKLMAAGGENQYVTVYDTDDTGSWREKARWPVDSSVLALSLSADGGSLAAGGDEFLTLYDLQNNTSVAELDGTHAVHGVSLSGDGSTLAVGGGNTKRGHENALTIYKVTKSHPKVAFTHATHAARIYSVAMCKDGSTVAAGCKDGKVKVYKVEDTEMNEHAEFDHRKHVDAISMNADGTILAVGDGHKKLTIYDLKQKTAMKTFAHDSFIKMLGMSADGSTLAASAYKEDHVTVYDLAGLCPMSTFAHNTKGHMLAVSLSEDGTAMVTGSSSGEVKVYNTKAPTTMLWCRTQKEAHAYCTVSMSGTKLLIGSHERHQKQLARNNSRRDRDQEHALVRTTRSFGTLTRSTTRSTHDQEVRMTSKIFCFDVCRKQPIPLPPHKVDVYAVSLSGDGDTIAYGGDDRTVTVYRLHSNAMEHVATFLGTLKHKALVHAVSLSHDGKVMAVGSDKTISIYESLNSVACVEHNSKINAITMDKDGMVILASEDEEVSVYDFRPGKVILAAEDEEVSRSSAARIRYSLKTNSKINCETVHGISLSRDGTRVAIGEDHSRVVVYDVGTWVVIASFEVESDEEYLKVNTVSLSPDGKILAVGDDHRLSIFNVDSQCIVAALDKGDKVRAISIGESPSGLIIASGGEKKVATYDLERVSGYIPDPGPAVKALQRSTPYPHMAAGFPFIPYKFLIKLVTCPSSLSKAKALSLLLRFPGGIPTSMRAAMKHTACPTLELFPRKQALENSTAVQHRGRKKLGHFPRRLERRYLPNAMAKEMETDDGRGDRDEPTNVLSEAIKQRQPAVIRLLLAAVACGKTPIGGLEEFSTSVLRELIRRYPSLAAEFLHARGLMPIETADVFEAGILNKDKHFEGHGQLRLPFLVHGVENDFAKHPKGLWHQTSALGLPGKLAKAMGYRAQNLLVEAIGFLDYQYFEQDVKAYVLDYGKGIGDRHFMRALVRCQTLDIFDTEVIAVLLEWKWRQFGQRCHIVLFVMYAALVATFTIWAAQLARREDGTETGTEQQLVGLAIAVIAQSLFFAILELFQAWQQGMEFYCTDPFNLLDILTICVACATPVLWLGGGPGTGSIGISSNHTDTAEKQYTYHDLQPMIATASCLLYLRTLAYMRSFRKTGPLVTLLTKVVIEMFPCEYTLYHCIRAANVVFSPTSHQQHAVLFIIFVVMVAFAEGFTHLGSFSHHESLFRTFTLMVGEYYLDSPDLAPSTMQTRLVFTMYLVIAMIILLNLLVSCCVCGLLRMLYTYECAPDCHHFGCVRQTEGQGAG